MARIANVNYQGRDLAKHPEKKIYNIELGDDRALEIVLERILTDYTLEVARQINAVLKKYAYMLADELKIRSPKDTGKYAKGWKVKEGDGKYIVYNSAKPSLTYILEFGAMREKQGLARAQPHIRGTAQSLLWECNQEIKKIIGG